MRDPLRRRFFRLSALGSVLLLQLLGTGCSGEADRGTPEVDPRQAARPAHPAPGSNGPAITRAGVNPPGGGTFTCWVKGHGFESGDKVLVNGGTEIPTTFGGPELVTFVAPSELLEGRSALSLVVLRPGTDLRSNPFDVLVPSRPPES